MMKKTVEHPLDFFGFLSLAFPNREHLETGFLQCLKYSFISLSVPISLVAPELRIRLRDDCAVRAVVHVPEAAMNQNNFLMSAQDQVRLPWQVPTM